MQKYNTTLIHIELGASLLAKFLDSLTLEANYSTSTKYEFEHFSFINYNK